jgi:hypothetical protein
MDYRVLFVQEAVLVGWFQCEMHIAGFFGDDYIVCHFEPAKLPMLVRQIR